MEMLSVLSHERERAVGVALAECVMENRRGPRNGEVHEEDRDAHTRHVAAGFVVIAAARRRSGPD